MADLWYLSLGSSAPHESPIRIRVRQQQRLTVSFISKLEIGLAITLVFLASRAARAQGVAETDLASRAAQPMTGSELFSKLLEGNHIRDHLLEQYSETRNYVVRNPKGKIHAETIVRLHYKAPDAKSFATVCEEGSGVVRNLVFKRLIESELDTASGRNHHDSSITPANYEFQLLREQDGDRRHYFVVSAVPRRSDKYLFEGTIWIDSQDFAIAKISGHPARDPSFWIRQVDFVREYRKIGQFWLPLKDESTTHLKIFGTKILTVDHSEYVVNQSDPRSVPPDSGSRECQPTQTALVKH